MLVSALPRKALLNPPANILFVWMCDDTHTKPVIINIPALLWPMISQYVNSEQEFLNNPSSSSDSDKTDRYFISNDSDTAWRYDLYDANNIALVHKCVIFPSSLNSCLSHSKFYSVKSTQREFILTLCWCLCFYLNALSLFEYNSDSELI